MPQALNVDGNPFNNPARKLIMVSRIFAFWRIKVAALQSPIITQAKRRFPHPFTNSSAICPGFNPPAIPAKIPEIRNSAASSSI